MLKGTDISAYQSSIPSGDFCIMKATEGTTYVDSPFASRWAQFRTSSSVKGMLRGAYHFAHPANNPVTEANFFLGVVRSAGLASGDVLALDFESSDGMSAAHCSTWAQTWCSHVASSVGYKPIVYTFLSFAESGNCAGLSNYHLWIADPSSPAGSPRVPSPWSTWVIHQYGSPGGVDQDIFNGVHNDWIALGGGGSPSPANSKDNDMPYGTLSEGAQAITPISLPKGQYKTIGFFCDNGLQGLPPAQLRVAIHDTTWHVSTVTVDGMKGQAVVTFPNIAETVGVSVRREDAGGVHIAWEVS